MSDELEIEEQVIADIRRRRDLGRARYGATMERGDLNAADWAQHLLEELLDGAIYMKRLTRDLAALPKELQPKPPSNWSPEC